MKLCCSLCRVHWNPYKKQLGNQKNTNTAKTKNKWEDAFKRGPNKKSNNDIITLKSNKNFINV